MVRTTSHSVRSAILYARRSRHFCVSLAQNSVFEVLATYCFLWVILLALIAGFIAVEALHSGYYPYDLSVPIKLL
jgi:hypothetical protein